MNDLQADNRRLHRLVEAYRARALELERQLRQQKLLDDFEDDLVAARTREAKKELVEVEGVLEVASYLFLALF